MLDLGFLIMRKKVNLGKKYWSLERKVKGFFVDPKAVELTKYGSISFEDTQKINNFCFMHKGAVQKLSLLRPLEYQTLNGHKSVNF